MVGIRAAIIAAVLVVSVPAHGEPQEDDAYLDKQRGIAFEMQAPFGDRTKNYEQAVGFYKTAAAKGNARAQQLLANAYRNGRGVPRSYLLAVKPQALALATTERRIGRKSRKFRDKSESIQRPEKTFYNNDLSVAGPGGCRTSNQTVMSGRL